MKHSYDDGRGRREVWLDGMLLTHVIECDTDRATALVSCQPLQIDADGYIKREWVQGECMVVVQIENDSQNVSRDTHGVD